MYLIVLVDCIGFDRTLFIILYSAIQLFFAANMSINVQFSSGLRPKKIGLGLDLGLAVLMLCYETKCCYARRHNDLEGHSNFSSSIYSFSIL